MNVFFDVDTQRDFCMPKGGLYVPGAYDICHNLHFMNILAVKSGAAVISTMDTHMDDDKEFLTYPPHCLADEPGWEKLTCTMPYGKKFVQKYEVGSKPSSKDVLENNHFIFEKSTYDIWDEKKGNPDGVNRILSDINPGAIFLYGVATDVCVVAAARGLAGKAEKLYLVKDAIAGIDPENTMKAIEEMEKIGFVSISVTQVWGSIQ